MKSFEVTKTTGSITAATATVTAITTTVTPLSLLILCFDLFQIFKLFFNLMCVMVYIHN